MTFQKDGPKRRRYTRRELPNGQKSEYAGTTIHFANEREGKRAPTVASNSNENNNERNW
jgi:hypothetical protein